MCFPGDKESTEEADFPNLNSQSLKVEKEAGTMMGAPLKEGQYGGGLREEVGKVPAPSGPSGPRVPGRCWVPCIMAPGR